MPVLESKRAVLQLIYGEHLDLPEKTLLVKVVESLHAAVPPWLRRRNEPRLHSAVQAEANKRPHASRIFGTAGEGEGIVHLDSVRNTQTFPDIPEAVHDALRSFRDRGVQSAPRSGQIDHVETVEANRPLQVARSDEIRLMGVVDPGGRKSRIRRSLGGIAPRSSMRQFVPRENPVDGAERRQRRNAHVLQLPEDGLSAAEDLFVVEAETDKLHDLLDFIRRSVGAVFRTPR
ncbi:hypothetical protein SDC9_145871 [bioreactor metagenome]|uniref:Uncharacterized protein n=1 Tax=bioreactor metagenome TaxID=1076179 RepID=A0A645ED67_9ZZZZ